MGRWSRRRNRNSAPGPDKWGANLNVTLPQAGPPQVGNIRSAHVRLTRKLGLVWECGRALSSIPRAAEASPSPRQSGRGQGRGVARCCLSRRLVSRDLKRRGRPRYVGARCLGLPRTGRVHCFWRHTKASRRKPSATISGPGCLSPARPQNPARIATRIALARTAPLKVLDCCGGQPDPGSIIKTAWPTANAVYQLPRRPNVE